MIFFLFWVLVFVLVVVLVLVFLLVLSVASLVLGPSLLFSSVAIGGQG